MHDLPRDSPVTGKDVDVVGHVHEPSSGGVVRQPHQSLLQSLGDVAQPLLGCPLRVDGLVERQVGLACRRRGKVWVSNVCYSSFSLTCQGARPDERIAQNGPLEVLFVVREGFFGGLADKDLIVWLQMAARLFGHEGIFSQQRHVGDDGVPQTGSAGPFSPNHHPV